MWLGKLTTLDMTPLGWLGRKTSTQPIRFLDYCSFGGEIREKQKHLSRIFSFVCTFFHIFIPHHIIVAGYCGFSLVLCASMCQYFILRRTCRVATHSGKRKIVKKNSLQGKIREFEILLKIREFQKKSYLSIHSLNTWIGNCKQAIFKNGLRQSTM